MAILYFPAFVMRAKQGYEVRFPDLPDCSSTGSTIQEAARNAEATLVGYLVLRRECNQDIPQPTDLDTIKRDPDVDEVVRILVKAELPSRKVRVSLTLDEALLAAIDAVSPNRSSFLENAAREVLRRRIRP